MINKEEIETRIRELEDNISKLQKVIADLKNQLKEWEEEDDKSLLLG